MPIPNISTLFQRVNSGSEGGNEFARYIKLLLSADYESKGEKFISESDASGDYKKVDAYIPGDVDFPLNIIAFQFKFFPCSLSSNQKIEIGNSIEKAIEENPLIQEFILITPEDFRKEQQEWFDDLRKRHEKKYQLTSNGLTRICYFRLTHWGHSKIIEMSLKHDYIGCHYFPELFPVGVGKFRLAQAEMDCTRCNWKQSMFNKYGYYQDFREMSQILTSDPLFDFQFTNSSAEIFLLQGIEVHIEEVKTKLRGIPAEYFLKSIGTIKHRVDFSRDVNTIALENPMIFEASKPIRFNVQLTNFTEDCPWNFVRLKFWFHFSNYSIATNSFVLNF